MALAFLRVTATAEAVVGHGYVACPPVLAPHTPAPAPPRWGYQHRRRGCAPARRRRRPLAWPGPRAPARRWWGLARAHAARRSSRALGGLHARWPRAAHPIRRGSRARVPPWPSECARPVAGQPCLEPPGMGAAALEPGRRPSACPVAGQPRLVPSVVAVGAWSDKMPDGGCSRGRARRL